MTTRPILIIPEPKLRTLSDQVEKIDGQIRKLVEDMFDTMYDAPGIGLAAIQVGVQKRVVTIDVAREGEAKKPLALINPEIIAASDETSVYSEGCLSIPGLRGVVPRARRLAWEAEDLEGRHLAGEAEGLAARVMQHEHDHLDGVLYLSRMTDLCRLGFNEELARQPPVTPTPEDGR